MVVDSEVVDLIANMTDAVGCIVDVPDLTTRAASVVKKVLRHITNCCIFVREYIGLGFSGMLNVFFLCYLVRQFLRKRSNEPS